MLKRKLLIPLDGSDHSRTILTHVRRLMPPSEYEIILLHVVDPPHDILASPPPRVISSAWPEPMFESASDAKAAHHPIYSTQSWESTRAEHEEDLAIDTQTLRDTGYEVRSVIEFGNPAETIVQVARQEHADMVAMATHGRTGLSHLLIGSVAERVLRELGNPVMLVRPFEAG